MNQMEEYIKKNNIDLEKDSGNILVQINNFKKKITNLQSHLQKTNKDKNNKSSILKIVGKLNSSLRYLKKTNKNSYEEVIKILKSKK